MNQENTMQETPAAALEQREMELARREEVVRKRELRARAMEELTEKQMPGELCDLLDYSGEEAWRASMDTLMRVWSRAVQAGVEKRVASAAPKAGGTGETTGSMRDAISAYYGK